MPHTVTSTTNRSKPLDTDDKFTFTFTTPGTYVYFCSLHPHMRPEPSWSRRRRGLALPHDAGSSAQSERSLSLKAGGWSMLVMAVSDAADKARQEFILK